LRHLLPFLFAMFALSSFVFAAAETKKPAKKGGFAQTVCSKAELEADANGIDKAFLIRLLYKESLFNPNAVSPKGAQGLAQFMPETAARVGLADPFDPEQAIASSAKFLRVLKNEFGNLGLAAAAYNAGEGRVRNWLAGKGGMPLETQDYVAFITGKEVVEWRESTAAHSIPSIGKNDSFAKNCLQLASRTIIVVGKRVARRAGLPGVAIAVKPKPWGAMLTADFSETRALAMFNRLKLRFPGKLGTQRPMVVRKKDLSRGTKAIAAVMLGANTQAEAITKCRSLVSDGIPCVVRKN
jgi:Transglycosylase SLT domain